jgi:hypothetical protein
MLIDFNMSISERYRSFKIVPNQGYKGFAKVSISTRVKVNDEHLPCLQVMGRNKYFIIYSIHTM